MATVLSAIRSAIASAFPRSHKLPEVWRHEFNLEIADINFQRSRTIAKATIIFIPFLILGLPHFHLSGATESIMYVLHVSASVISALFLLFAPNTSPYRQSAVGFYAIAFFAIVNGVFTVVWQISGVTTPFICGIFVFSVAFYYPGRISLTLYGLNYLFYLICIHAIAIDVQSAIDVYRYGFIASSSGAACTAAAWLFMRIGMESRKQSFLNRKTIEQKTEELAQANAHISELNHELHSENSRMRAELHVARRLQQLLLPKPNELESIPGLDIAAFMEPATEVGGDYYDVLSQGNGAKIGIGDITDHGLESGVLMLMVQTAVRVLKESGIMDPVQFAAILNRAIYDNVQRMGSDRSLTLALLDYEEGHFRLAGQHEEAIVIRQSGELEVIPTGDLGLPLGLERDITEFMGCKDFQLNAGDVLILYTDGITEAENATRELYGLQRLCAIAQKFHLGTAAEIRDAIVRDVQTYIGTANVYDDITLVVCKQR